MRKLVSWTKVHPIILTRKIKDHMTYAKYENVKYLSYEQKRSRNKRKW